MFFKLAVLRIGRRQARYMLGTFLTFMFHLAQCPFGRVIYIFEYKNAPFLRQLQSEITAVNAEALELDTLPQHVIEAALSTYKLSR